MRPTVDVPLRVPGEGMLLTLLKYAPFEPQRLLLERLLRDAYPDALRDGVFAPLRGRWLRIELSDSDAQGRSGRAAAPGWNVTLGRDGLVLAAGPVSWDVRIAASIDDFVLLANQQADPDTLFFQRRLVIEGDTELGLVVKNLIFGSELAGVPAKTARFMLGVREAWLRRRSAPKPVGRMGALPQFGRAHGRNPALRSGAQAPSHSCGSGPMPAT